MTTNVHEFSFSNIHERFVMNISVINCIKIAVGLCCYM